MAPEPGDRIEIYALAQLQRAIVCLGWRGANSHAGVHQARKSIRRVRASLALGQEKLGAGGVLVSRELAKICDSLSALRDAQARVECLNRLLDGELDAPLRMTMQRGIRLALRARAEAMRKELLHDPGFQSRRQQLGVLLAALRVLPWEDVSISHLLVSAKQSMQRCDEAAETALARGRDEDWHRLRRRRRRLAQQHTALDSSDIVLPSIVVPDRKLAVLLGEAQDLSMLREYFKKHSGLSPPQVSQVRSFLKQEFDRISAEAMGTP